MTCTHCFEWNKLSIKNGENHLTLQQWYEATEWVRRNCVTFNHKETALRHVWKINLSYSAYAIDGVTIHGNIQYQIFRHRRFSLFKALTMLSPKPKGIWALANGLGGISRIWYPMSSFKSHIRTLFEYASVTWNRSRD